MKEEKTIVIFRRWNDHVHFPMGGVIALFPKIAYGESGSYCMSYEHIGQHGAADYQGIIQQTRPALPQEFAGLKHELESIGYNLTIRTRNSYEKNHSNLANEYEFDEKGNLA